MVAWDEITRNNEAAIADFKEQGLKGLDALFKYCREKDAVFVINSDLLEPLGLTLLDFYRSLEKVEDLYFSGIELPRVRNRIEIIAYLVSYNKNLYQNACKLYQEAYSEAANHTRH